MSGSMQLDEALFGERGYAGSGSTRRPAAPRNKPARHAQAGQAGANHAASQAALAQAIERQIVPRLVLRRTPPGIVQPALEDGTFTVPTGAVSNLAALALSGDPNGVRFYVQDAISRQGMESICLDMLAPTARHLGDLWNEDLCSFADVTIGLLRLQEAMHVVAATVGQPAAEVFRRHRIVLAAAPGDQHTFGVSMVSTFFQKAGWAVTPLHDSTLPDLAALLGREWFAVLGISVGSEARLERLSAVLPRLRAISRNTGLAIMVGGPIFVAHPEIAQQIGADATAPDGVQATWIAENLLAETYKHG